ncbi:hypothetical protein NBRGN_026_00630 [Nocardia brasiliensis NBRC 14402]|uniref:hypothetical protein n=1 Tax=Nocardia brasiliensis TaxID=37326 RepID=UPI0002F9B4F8|nr:hypothetical protein [Nocardia brasiliensis]ASF09005.1 hypothetical protein CEQ30_18365 [Nocardia brasiliensis]GAJ80310.1 hypothetical protein NBRGN_026_00630 [Nocardia brasiliensis NBRC 14402]SUB40386.1 3-oxoacyl-(acyl carrier protein) synthase III [Nocardia brasiliensis]
MGVRIKSTGTGKGSDTFSSIGQSGWAARQSLERAELRPDQVGVLINVGVFRDFNTVEPAMSALIQKAAGIGLDYAYGDPRTFSFDLMNGAVGVLDAVQVAQSILETRSAEYVLIVSGDTHPSLSRSVGDDEFPYATAGAALLLELSDGPEAFGHVHTVVGRGDPAVESYVDVDTMGRSGRSRMTVEHAPDFEERLLRVADEVARTALAQGPAIDPATTVLIASTPTAEFPHRLAERLGITETRTPDISAGDPHTSALPLAYDSAVQDESLNGFSEVLFVAAGAGPTAAAVRYRLPDRIEAHA